MSAFKTIGLIGRDDKEIIESLIILAQFLDKTDSVDIVLEESISKKLPEHSYSTCNLSDFRQVCDLAIVVGGDGSILKVAAALAKQDLPVVGINKGRLGFLTDILPDEIESALSSLLKGEYKVESRFLLEMNIERDGKRNKSGAALNDVVLHPGKAVQMIEFELYIDNEFVYNQASDGLIVATPTGSTAYSMSAGGPIMHPNLDALVLVPINPHSLSSRPIVVDGDSEIKIVVGDRHGILPQVSCDGFLNNDCKPGDVIHVRKKVETLKIIHPADYNYYETCRSKLGWSHRPVNRR